MKIAIESRKAGLQDIDLLNIFQTPDIAFRQYWRGTDEEYRDYLQKHDLVKNWNQENLAALHREINDFIEKMRAALHKDPGRFDFRLPAAATARNMAPLSTEDYMVMTLDISQLDDATKETIKKNMFESPGRSLIDFRDIQGEKLIFVYNRRGIYDEGERIAIVKAKPSVTLKDGFASAKDNNFIMSGYIKSLSEGLPDDVVFSYTYVAG
ncbi:MAG: hypothetical protein GXO16_05870, partial [Epsilonproteobacteria bacterium]|nr:hypothetical protein [Campylobacterota bacterium]